MLRQDYHVHSELSPDSESTLDEICQQGIRMGFEEVALTDHYELIEGVTPRGSCRKEYLQISREKILKCRERWEGKIRLIFGIELGQYHKQPEAAKHILGTNPYDFVLASLHRVNHMDLSLYNYKHTDGNLLREQYFKELYEIAKKGDYDCLGHLDLIKRYASFQGVRLRAEDCRCQVEEILRCVVERGKGIEVNTSGISTVLSEPLPSLEILKWYRGLGGEIITTGSDAHRIGDIGKNFAQAAEILKAAGFRYVTRFHERKPEWISL